MNPVTILLIVLTAGVLFHFFLSFISYYNKKKKNDLVRRLCHEGAANNLVFCSQEILQNKVIGIDGIHRKIMILEKTKNTYHCSTISLDEVHDCQLVAQSGSIKKNRNNKLFYKQATTLALQFEFNNHSRPASIIFSNGLINSGRELAFLQVKAEYWRVMFSKMLNRQAEARA